MDARLDDRTRPPQLGSGPLYLIVREGEDVTTIRNAGCCRTQSRGVFSSIIRAGIPASRGAFRARGNW
ncbi:hypothetical protein [Streptomyces sp. DASNCL29]|uniref:hypothetical protein n=1 Tax=Streptomyces sp. DASNCL29 TaxID=2583819 RepID=UPI001485FE0A|nr:hypothetical protein [Streptomyces sp. DASNCL29]